jgi:SAM-dependent methyltransferase
MNPLMASTARETEIGTRPRPDCYLCGARGERLYQGLRDRLFGAPGVWNFNRCPNSNCGLVWLDPVPLEEDVLELYRNYYTHQEPRPAQDFFRKNLRRAYNVLLRLTPLWRERQRLRLMYLGDVAPGRLLEIGCGDGTRLAQLRARGWQVQGQEIDPQAAVQARARGLPIHLGKLETANFPDSGFDAVIMNHVIEHVHDPVALLKESRRVLKPGGKLITVTPNIESFGHLRFGPAWRGLEPPRHFQIFSPRTLSAVAARAGIKRIETWTTPANAQGIAIESLALQRAGGGRLEPAPSLSTYLGAVWIQLRAWLDWKNNPHSGEECVLQATT